MAEWYSEDDIFNVDETACFYQLLPDRALHFKGLIKAPAQLEDNLEEDHSNLGDLWTEVQEMLPDVPSFNDYVDSNSAALTSADMTTKEIINSVHDVSSDKDDPEEEDSVSPNTEEDDSVSHSDVLVRLYWSVQ
ncbi:hypothetical protein HPB50_021430 [Hyalomma asiaticum]|uniref:Uncharacterized protein n=1 Tax=Hyalomma asiaticum TaxID=266040 RepID=A0ACB7TLW2_HYAAI|nr:hypothetical protein HPB50_021430 [Hyalomma asiaticum]